MSIDAIGDDLASGSPAAARDRSRPSLAELHAASDRLWYEYWMLRCTARASSADAAIASALEESFALHLRNLHAFLYGGLAGGLGITAEDFLGSRWAETRPERSPLLIEAVTWAERTLATMYRMPASGARPPRDWTLLQASFEMQKVTDPFISSLPRELLGARWKVIYEHGLSV
jgi:hypothetical protein